MKRITSIEKNILLEINLVLKDDLDKLKYNKISRIYNNINNLLKKNNIEIYDFNKLLKEYNIKNNLQIIIKKIKKFIKIRNKKILNIAIQSRKWGKYLKKLEEDSHIILKKYSNKITKEKIEKSLLELLKKYDNNWLGYWKIIKLNKNKIDEIDIFDKDDYNNFLKKLKNNIKKM